MSKRRPPLPLELAELAATTALTALEIMNTDRDQAENLAKTLGQGDLDFREFCDIFLNTHMDAIISGLSSVFDQNRLELSSVPLVPEVFRKFMKSVEAEPEVEIRPAFHGTNKRNYPSIFTRGLLIPGQGNELKIVNGAAHGFGVYTANLDAAWLSRSFCSDRSLLICAVLHNKCVHHAGDAMIVGKADHVVPLFEGFDMVDSTVHSLPMPPGQPLPTQPLKNVGTAKAKAKGKDKKADAAPKDKSSKFKAKLATKAGRH